MGGEAVAADPEMLKYLAADNARRPGNAVQTGGMPAGRLARECVEAARTA